MKNIDFLFNKNITEEIKSHIQEIEIPNSSYQKINCPPDFDDMMKSLAIRDRFAILSTHNNKNENRSRVVIHD